MQNSVSSRITSRSHFYSKLKSLSDILFCRLNDWPQHFILIASIAHEISDSD